jgi:hypothetical protein
MAGVDTIITHIANTTILTLGFLSMAKNVAGKRVTNIAVTNAGTINNSKSCSTAAILIIGTDAAPALYCIKPTIHDVIIKQNSVIHTNSAKRFPNVNDSFIYVIIDLSV